MGFKERFVQTRNLSERNVFHIPDYTISKYDLQNCFMCTEQWRIFPAYFMNVHIYLKLSELKSTMFSIWVRLRMDRSV